MDTAKAISGGVLSYIIGPGFIPQILLTIVFFIALQVILSIIQGIIDTVRNVTKQVTVLQAETVTGPYTIAQDPLLQKQIFNSNNELNGLEFSYSAFIFVSPETFDNSASTEDSCGNVETTTGLDLKSVFHKGSKTVFPLMAPGVFMESNKNTMRVYMNSSLAWDNYVSVPNIPVNKWFHLVITMKGKFMDVFINGNVAQRKEFLTVPKLNVGNVYIMSNQKFPKRIVGDEPPPFKVSGGMKGMVSRLSYYAYALNYSQIDDLYRQGPAKKVVNPTPSISGVIPPYLRDDWWVTRY
jgi:hypothetical protein